MRTLSAFLAQLSKDKTPFQVWEYDNNQQYRLTEICIKNVSALNKLLDTRLQWIIEIAHCNQTFFYLVLPEINAVTPVQFAHGRVQALTHAA